MKRIIASIIALSLALSLSLTSFAEETATENTVGTPVQSQFSKDMARSYLVYLVSTLYGDYYYDDVTEADYLFAALSQTIDDGYFDLDRSIKAMVENMDEFSGYFPADTFTEVVDSIRGEFFGIGVVMSKSIDDVMVMEVYDGSPAQKAGMRMGDIIKSADDTILTGMNLDDVRALITGEKGTYVKLGIVRDGVEMSFDVCRDEINVSSISSSLCADNTIGYVKISSFTLSLEEFLKPVLDDWDKKGIKKLIIDLRGNGGGEVNAALMLAKLVLPGGVLTKVHYKDATRNEDLTYENDITTPKYDLVVLTDNYSASASEMFSGCVKARALGRIIGEETYGKGSMQTLFRTITGSGIKYTFAEFYTPKDERIHTIGIKPDDNVQTEYVLPDVSNYEAIDFDKINSTQSGKNIMAIEQRLAVLGIFDSAADEVWDEETAKAVSEFQAYMNRPITSLPNLDTLIALNDIDYDFYIAVDSPKQTAIDYLMKK